MIMNKGLSVIGMHRSGTSVCTAFLKAMGFFIGSNIEINSNNNVVSGYNERNDVNNLNEKILSSLDSAWTEPFNLSKNKIEEKNFFNETKIIIDKLNSSGDNWVVKDPRLCLTYNYWSQHFDDNCNILILRNPFEISLSLFKRDNLNIYHNLVLTDFYLHSFFSSNFDKKKTKVINFDDLINKTESVIFDLYNFLKENNYKNIILPDKQKLNSILKKKNNYSENLLSYFSPDIKKKYINKFYKYFKFEADISDNDIFYT